MANLEENILQITQNKRSLYLRNIDDIFMLWTYGEEELEQFHKNFIMEN